MSQLSASPRGPGRRERAAAKFREWAEEVVMFGRGRGLRVDPKGGEWGEAGWRRRPRHFLISLPHGYHSLYVEALMQDHLETAARETSYPTGSSRSRVAFDAKAKEVGRTGQRAGIIRASVTMDAAPCI